jgi:hypothetical protein
MQRIFIVTGLQRSGNHAIQDWVRSLFESSVFYNDQPHDLFDNTDNVNNIIQDAGHTSCIIFSFEDSVDKSQNPTAPILEDISKFSSSIGNDARVRCLWILRDPYNTWASRIAARERVQRKGNDLTSSPSWELFRTNWLAMAKLYQQRPDDFILFNFWRKSPEYRLYICENIGGCYNEATLERVPTYGQGSSFDGNSRPTYREIIRNLNKYMSAEFITKFRKKPYSYLRRIMKPPLKATNLRVDERWHFLLHHPEGKKVLSDEDIRAASLGIFGFAVWPDGEMRRGTSVVEPIATESARPTAL